MSDEVLDSGLYIPVHGLGIEDLRILAAWHRSLAKSMHDRAAAELDTGDMKAAVFQLRISEALSTYAKQREAGRGQRLQIRFESVLTQGGFDLEHEPEDDE